MTDEEVKLLHQSLSNGLAEYLSPSAAYFTRYHVACQLHMTLTDEQLALLLPEEVNDPKPSSVANPDKDWNADCLQLRLFKIKEKRRSESN